MAAVARAVANPAARLTGRFFDKIGSDELMEIRDRVDHVLAERARQLRLILSPTELVNAPERKVIPTVQPHACCTGGLGSGAIANPGPHVYRLLSAMVVQVCAVAP